MKTKAFWTSKELWLVFLALTNLALNKYGLRSFEPTQEFYGAVLLIIGTLRVWFTDSRLTLKRN